VRAFTKKTKDYDAYVHYFSFYFPLFFFIVETNLFLIILDNAAVLFAGKSIPIGWDDFSEIVNEGCTFLDKTSLIAEFIECNSKVSLIVRPRRFGKTINLTMLRDFFSIPIYPDNEDYRRKLFKNTKIIKERPDLFNNYFCKHPVIFLSLKV
jgi:hypothetical protein